MKAIDPNEQGEKQPGEVNQEVATDQATEVSTENSEDNAGASDLVD